MRLSRRAVMVGVLLALLPVPFWFQSISIQKLQQEKSHLLLEKEDMARLEAEDEELRNTIAHLKAQHIQANGPSSEVLRLRGEVTLLRRILGQNPRGEVETNANAFIVPEGAPFVSPSQNIRKVPVLADLPIVGNLFQTTDFGVNSDGDRASQ